MSLAWSLTHSWNWQILAYLLLYLFLIKKCVLSPVINLDKPVVFAVYRKGLKIY